MYINKTKLLDNFINIKNVVNINILICYKQLFTKNGILKNIGCFLLIIFILFHIISIFVFYINQLAPIINKIDDLIFGIKHCNSIEKDKVIITTDLNNNINNLVKENKSDINNKAKRKKAKSDDFDNHTNYNLKDNYNKIKKIKKGIKSKKNIIKNYNTNFLNNYNNPNNTIPFVLTIGKAKK